MATVKAVKAWQDSDGTLHATIEGWQQAELVGLLKTTDGSGLIVEKGDTAQHSSADIFVILAKGLIKGREALLAILTTGPRARPKARKAVGTTQPKRAARGRATTEQVSGLVAAMRDATNASSDDITLPRG
jgi:hypothetical protein